MNRLLILLLFILTIPSTFAQPIEERMAVLELKNKAGFSREEVEYLSSLLRRLASSELAQSFIVYDKENITELLPPDVNLEDCEGQCAVETGRNINATYIITGTIIRFGKNLRISIDLHDTRSGRLIGSEVASGKEINDMESGIQEAGGRLLRKLMKGPKIYSKAKSTRKVIGETSTTLVGTSNKRVIATLLSEPRGAAVMIDGVQKCSEGKEVCKIELTEGAHQLSMTKTDYFIRSGSVTIAKDRNSIEWSLDPSFATLKVITEPNSLKFSINGKTHHGSYSRRITPQKKYKVISDDPCYAKTGEVISAAKAGEEIRVQLSPSLLKAAIDVRARSSRGDPLKADIIVDGVELGTTPSEHLVSICSNLLTLKHYEHGEYQSDLSLSIGKNKIITAVINNSALVRYERSLLYKKIGFFTLASASIASVALLKLNKTCLSGDCQHLDLVFLYSSIATLSWAITCTAKGLKSMCPFRTESMYDEIRFNSHKSLYENSDIVQQPEVNSDGPDWLRSRYMTAETNDSRINDSAMAGKPKNFAQGTYWYCVCYKERYQGSPTLSTACRNSMSACQALQQKIVDGTRILIRGSAGLCIPGKGDNAWEATSTSRTLWRPSKKAGAWWTPKGCFAE